MIFIISHPFLVYNQNLVSLDLVFQDALSYVMYCKCLTDVRESSVLQESASSVGWNVNVDEMISGVGKEKLLQNTQEALDRGSFGVPRLVNIFKPCNRTQPFY